MGLDRVARRLKGEPVCGFDWPGDVPMTRRGCDGIPVGERDGKPACQSHLHPYEFKANRPYDDEAPVKP